MPGDLHDTICAIATPVGEGGIGILRISGEHAIDVGSRLVRVRSGQSLDSVESRKMVHADLLDPYFRDSSEEGIPDVGQPEDYAPWLDEALVVVMRQPHSFTGENVVEIQCHGGPLILQKVSHALVMSGARLAEPGEFTKRAFLNGRMDLAQAEAVLDTIRAKNESGLRVAQELLRGQFSLEVNRVREILVRLFTLVEASIDFSEEELPAIRWNDILSGIQDAKRVLDRLLGTWKEGRIFRNGALVPLVGAPNVGKSSLLNALLHTDRAIVTDIPGTTRDILEESLDIRGLAVRLVDTAGIHDTSDQIELEGIKRTEAALSTADLVVIVIDGSSSLSEGEREFLAKLNGNNTIIAFNKADLPGKTTPFDVMRMFDASPAWPMVRVSAKTGLGVDELCDGIRRLLLRPDFEPGESVVVTRVRHWSALKRARGALADSQAAIANGESPECIAIELRTAGEALGEITGAITTEEILDQIFSEFCIGK